jgi:PKD repeat protein
MTSSQPNPLISFTTSGNYTVSLTVTNPIGSSTATQNILINALPEPVVDAGLNADICVGESVNLAATTSLAGTILWTPNTGLSNTNTLTPIASPTTSRTYILTITTPNGCDGQDSIHIGVSPSPTVWAGNDVTINAGDSTQLSPAGSNNLLYSWQPSTGLSNPAIKNPKASPAGTTYYLLTVTNTFGCTKSDWVLVTVNGGVTSISPNGTTNFNVSPNPFANDLWISAEFLEAHHMSLSLFDITGKFVANIWEGEVQQGSFDYNWQNTLPAGLYFLEYKTEETIFRQKLIRE